MVELTKKRRTAQSMLHFVCKHGLVHAVRGVSCLLWPLVGRVTTYLSLAVAGDGGTARRVKVAIQCPVKVSFSKIMPSFLVHLLTQEFQMQSSFGLQSGL
jgi:hypothetical protein